MYSLQRRAANGVMVLPTIGYPHTTFWTRLRPPVQLVAMGLWHSNQVHPSMTHALFIGYACMMERASLTIGDWP
jgi:hypothetical protein